MASFPIIAIGAACIGLCLGLLGSGGSIVTVPVLVYLVGQDEKVAIAGSLAIVGIIALVASVNYMWQRQVNWRMVVLFGVPGMMGTFFGAYASAWVSGLFQLAVFALVMLLASYFMLKSTSTSVQPESSEIKKRNIATIGTEGALVGVVTGFVGVGGGFLIVPALALLGGLRMHQAVATSLVIIAMKSAVGFFKYLDILEDQNLAIDWKVVLTVSAIGIAGSIVGNQLASRTPQTLLKKLFGGFLILMGIYILARSAPELLA